MAKWKLKDNKIEEEKKSKKFTSKKKDKTPEQIEKEEKKKAEAAEKKIKAEQAKKAKKDKKAEVTAKKIEEKKKRNAERAKKKITKKRNRTKKINKFKKTKFGSILFKIGHGIAFPFVALAGLIKKILPKPKKRAPKLTEAKTKEKQKKVITKRMKMMRKRTFALCFTCVAAVVVILFGFKVAGALELNAGYAAKTGDKYFTESEVTKYITEQTLYKTYAKSQSQWQQYLSMYGQTPEKFRQQCIEDKFQHDELVRLACEKEGIVVNDDEVEQHVNAFKARYKSDSEYKKALDQAGYTEDTYKDNVKQTSLEKALIAKVVTSDTPSDDDVKTYLSSYSSVYKDARQSSHILFDAKDTDKAQQVLDQINSGKLTFEAAVSQYSIDAATKGKGGDRGWDKIESFSGAYNSSLSGLNSGEVYKELVTDKDGIHIVKCTAKWDTPEKIESLDGVPAAIKEECRKKKDDSNKETKLKDWLKTFADDNGIESEIFPMPSGLPYYVEAKSSSTSAVGGTSTGGTTTTTTE